MCVEYGLSGVLNLVFLKLFVVIFSSFLLFLFFFLSTYFLYAFGTGDMNSGLYFPS